MKDELRIKQLEKKFKIKHMGLLSTALFLESLNLEISISDGILNKESLITPCIIFAFAKKPKLRFLNENRFLKSFLGKIGKKNFKTMSNREYVDYISSSTRNGETSQYKKWRENNQEKVNYVKSLITEFNKKREPSILELTQFEDGLARIDFGADDSVFNKRQRMSFLQKKELFEAMLNEFNLFSLYLKEFK